MRNVIVSVSLNELLVELALQSHVGHWDVELRCNASTQHTKRHVGGEFYLLLYVLRLQEEREQLGLSVDIVPCRRGGS